MSNIKLKLKLSVYLKKTLQFYVICNELLFEFINFVDYLKQN